MSRLLEIYGLDQVTRLDESSLPLVIGTDPSAQIRLEGDGGTLAWLGESRNHLFLQPAAGAAELQPIYHNDQPLTNSVWLKSGDTLRWGLFLIRWELSGRRVEIRVSRLSTEPLTPPVAPPVLAAPERDPDAAGEFLHPVLDPPRPASRRRFRYLLATLFLLLLAGVAFVLLAKPLVVSVMPSPDSLSVSGFPLLIDLGDRYLGLPGEYELRAKKEGYRPLAEKVRVTAGNSSYSFVFEKLPGLLDVDSQPTGVTLLVDGVISGTTPIQDLELAVGQRSLRFEHPRYLPQEKTVEILGGGDRQSLQVKLRPAWAVVTILTDPDGASLQVDGEEQGVTPLELELLAGERKLSFSKTGFSLLDVDLRVVAGEELKPDVFRLVPAPAHIVVTSTPTGATVSADGQFEGQTPLTLSLMPGVEHEVRVTAAGHLSQSHQLKFVADEQRELKVSLEPEYGTVFITATPANATLSIDGKKQDQATGRFRLTTRAHKLELQASDYQTSVTTVTPQAGYSQRIELELKPRPGSPVAPPSLIKVAPLTGLGQKLILVKPHPFEMGASRKEPGRRANEREFLMQLEHNFYLSEREVTNREFLQFRAQHSSGVAGSRSLEIDSHPVVNVSWDDAARFLNWLSQKDGLPPFYHEQNGVMVAADPNGSGYRLPREAEWAFAARIADRKEPARYPWDGDYPPKKVVGNFADESARHVLPRIIEGYNDRFAATAPTGSFTANSAGFFDLGGNVAEWCDDVYVANLAAAVGNTNAPAMSVGGAHHSVRGSSWSDASITELRYSYRRYSREAANDIGFRIARSAR